MIEKYINLIGKTDKRTTETLKEEGSRSILKIL